MITLEDLLEQLECKGVKNEKIVNSYIKAFDIINDKRYNRILCSVSGGADSDIMLDILHRVDNDNKIRYVWFDTGLEYQATKNHLKYLEDKYNIEIERRHTSKTIPYSCNHYGQPFLSKEISAKIHSLQKDNFNWKDGSYDELKEQNPNCQVSALRWWCNLDKDFNSVINQFTIGHKKWLKEFMIQNPPAFPIHNICCNHAKKDISHKYVKAFDIDLVCLGLRKAEGGVRAFAYNNCYDENIGKADNYRPLFHWLDEDKKYYEELFEIKHSDCYDKWGFKRTGCVGCPYNRNWLQELETASLYEDKLIDACKNVFGDSYEYTKKYKEFCFEMDSKYGNYKKYLRALKNRKGETNNEK